MSYTITAVVFITVIIGLLIRFRTARNKRKLLQQRLAAPFPDSWRQILLDNVLFYEQLESEDRHLFEERVKLFLADKTIRAIDTDIDDTVRVLVAASAIIPTFAFPAYNYPHVHTVLIYPNSFDENFQTQRYKGHKEFIIGIVGDRALNGTVILSKPDILRSFDGVPHQHNVGIHEFVHLLDNEDGAIDGVPEALITRPFVGPWLHQIKIETDKIRRRKSDIDPYALKNNAEFLAVVSEYFFDNPVKFQKRHPELHQLLSAIFTRKKEKSMLKLKFQA